jgi:hypothetical protein
MLCAFKAHRSIDAMTRLERLAREAGFDHKRFTDTQLLKAFDDLTRYADAAPALRAQGLTSVLDTPRGPQPQPHTQSGTRQGT